MRTWDGLLAPLRLLLNSFHASVEVTHPRLNSNRDEYLHVFRGIPKQAPKRDGVGDCAQIDEQNGGEGLDMQRVVEVAGKKRQLSLDVEDETTTKPSRPNH